jgi:hypothetical protein
MTYKLMLVLAVAAFTLSTSAVSAGEHGQAGAEKKIVIALKTDDFELVETDLSDLSVGDAETIYTESGQTVDLLRTEDGVEVYIDGELIDTGDGAHERHHVIHQEIEIECESEEECEDMDFDIDIDSAHGGKHHERVIIIKKKVETD